MICTGDMLAVWAPPRYCCAQCSHYTGGRELPRHCSQPGPLTLLPTHSCYMWLFFLGVWISYLTTEVESCFEAPPSFIIKARDPFFPLLSHIVISALSAMWGALLISAVISHWSNSLPSITALHYTYTQSGAWASYLYIGSYKPAYVDTWILLLDSISV